MAADLPNWNAATGLEAGTLNINKLTPTPYDFNISGTGTFIYDGSPKAVIVSVKPGKVGMGSVTAIKYNGSTTAPSNIGTYAVTFDVNEGPYYNQAIGLSAGNLIIKSEYLFNVTLVWSDLPTAPKIIDNGSSYSSDTGVINIKVILNNHSDYSGPFVWYNDFNSTPLTTANPYELNLLLNDKTDLGWSVPGEFTITLFINDKYSAKFKFEPTNH
ncbi:MBG domain-containing protein [Treponema sp. R80B11-R83G3]